jgi:CRP-like cAMP-binding protein
VPEFDPRGGEHLPFHDEDEPGQIPPDTSEPSGDARIRHLQRVPLFSGFEEADLRRIVELSRIAEVAAGTTITQIGEPGDSFFVIIDGTVTTRTPIGTGGQMKPGDFFGEMSLLDGEPRSATVVATTDVRLLVVDRTHFWRLLEETPDLIRRILTILSRRVRRLEQSLHAAVRGANPV